MEEEKISINSTPTESTRLIEQQLPPPRLQMDEDKPSIFYDKSREFFDKKKLTQFKTKRYAKGCGKAACQSLTAGIISGGTLGPSISAFVLNCFGSITIGSINHTNLYLVMSSVICGGISFFGLGMLGLKDCEQASIEIAKAKRTLSIDKPLEIPSEMFQYAQENKKIFLPLAGLEGLRKSILDAKIPSIWEKLRKILIDPEGKILKKLDERIMPAKGEKNPTTRYILAKQFFKKFNDKNLVNYLLKFINFEEIYVKEHSFITEKELLTLLYNCAEIPSSDLCKIYATQALMAQKGWFQFKKSNQYPIQCEMRYFSTEKLKVNYYSSQGQTIFLPYDLELAECYQFEQDPLYNNEFMQPSSHQIASLLQERTKFLQKKTK